MCENMIAGATVIAENHNEYFYTLKSLSNIFYQKKNYAYKILYNVKKTVANFFHFIDRISNCVNEKFENLSKEKLLLIVIFD